MCMSSQMEYCLSHFWKLFQMVLMKEKKYGTYTTKHLQAW